MSGALVRDAFDDAWVLDEFSGCHEWKRSLRSGGYGQLNIGGRPMLAHRFAWVQKYGRIEGGLHVLHRCDNRKCVNVEHLFLGTNLDNIKDRMSKGRSVGPSNLCGDNHPMAKLTWETVGLIRAVYAAGGVSQRKLAERFGISQVNVGQIIRGETWVRRHVEVPKAHEVPKRVLVRDRFDSLVAKRESGCWEWTGRLDDGGYGKVRAAGGRRLSAHRFSYERANGEVPSGMVVRHKCDNRSCVNPEHLEVGTYADNSMDMVSRGRARGPVGERNSHARIKAKDADDIRLRVSAGERRQALAEEYGISVVQIGHIVNGLAWTAGAAC